MRTYSELIKFNTFEERFNYLKIGGKVGKETFGSHRYLNQKFYLSDAWKEFRRDIIIRDSGCDLGIFGFDIYTHIFVHHLTPISENDILTNNYSVLLNPENAISCSFKVHQAIHYGSVSMLPYFDLIERKPYDTCPWYKGE